MLIQCTAIHYIKLGISLLDIPMREGRFFDEAFSGQKRSICLLQERIT